MLECCTPRNKLQWNLNRNFNIFIQENAFESVVCETGAILSRPQCVKVMKVMNECIWKCCLHNCNHFAQPLMYSKSFNELFCILQTNKLSIFSELLFPETRTAAKLQTGVNLRDDPIYVMGDRSQHLSSKGYWKANINCAEIFTKSHLNPWDILWNCIFTCNFVRLTRNCRSVIYQDTPLPTAKNHTTSATFTFDLSSHPLVPVIICAK